MKAELLVELKNLSFKYADNIVLKDINLKIYAGERIVILGANGSGKSTLLKILDGLLIAQGIFRAFGENITEEYFSKEDNEQNFRKKVGYVFQDPDVQLFSPTVWDEVIFGPLHMGLSKNEVIERGNWALSLLEIEKLKHKVPHLLSGGEKKRVALASVISVKPKILLLDEPTASLDPRSQSRLLDYLNEINDKGHTIVTATHDLSILEEMAERVIILSENHKIVADSKPENILNDRKLLTSNNLIHEHTHKHNLKAHKHPHIHDGSHRRSIK